MARVLENYKFPSSRVSRAPLMEKYPCLPQWLDGRVWELTQEDFKIKPMSFHQSLYKAARRLGKSVSVRRQGDVIICQAGKRRGRKPQEQGGSQHVGTQSQT